MQGIRKPVVEFVGWRWAPTVGLLSAALLYVLLAVAIVPDEIGGPVPAAKISPASRALPMQTAAPDQTSTFPARTEEEAAPPAVHAPPPPAPVSITPAEFGRRGFSPPLERPPAPPEPVITPPPPPPPVPPPVVPPPAPDPALVAAQPQNPMMQRGLVGAAFNAARRVAGQVENNINGNVPPAPGQPGAAPVPPPPGAPGAAPGTEPAPPAATEAPPPAPPVPVQ